MTWGLSSPLRDCPACAQILGNVRSDAFSSAMRGVFLEALAMRSGEAAGDLLAARPRGVFGRYVLTGLMDLQPYGDVDDPTVGSGEARAPLDARTTELILVAILATRSSRLNLAFHVCAALQAGASISELEATLALTGRYAGADAAMDASAVLRFVEAALVREVSHASYSSADDPRAASDAQRFFTLLRGLGAEH